MSGRRKHSRITLLNSPGVLRFSRDVVMERATDNGWTAISREPGVVGEELRVVFSANGDRATELVRVTASRPMLIDGSVKHELRLEPVDPAANRNPSNDQIDRES
jgi:hypothetical protein